MKHSHTPQQIQRKGIVKIIILCLLVALQIWWLVSGLLLLKSRFPWVGTLFEVLTWVMIAFICMRNIEPEFKLFYVIIVAAFPVAGVLLYWLGGRRDATKKARRRYTRTDQIYGRQLPQDPSVLQQLSQEDPDAAGNAYYLAHYAFAPVYTGMNCRYFASASEALKAQEQDIASAEHYIFMEYLAIQDAECFRTMKETLIRKAREGVTVRIIYDDAGSVFSLDKSFRRQMESYGIKCQVFNPMKPLLNIFINNRDHRKITVVDGKIGYCGGYNIANQYFNLTHPYGLWKDAGVRLEGPAVRSMTLEFLSMWDAITGTQAPEKEYLPEPDPLPDTKKMPGYVQPFSDNPLDDEYVSKTMYLNLMKKARSTLWICTPYLVITKEIQDALTSAAKNHVDVRIVTPGIPDKIFVNNITKSYYARLLASGVRIFEYTPGFSHAKIVSADNRTAFVGSVNLDYRSLYHHFENGVMFYDSPVTDDVTADLMALFSQSREITLEQARKVNPFLRLIRFILRMFAVLF